ncbi:MAG: transcription-repair coupling factor [Leptospiraceae bacterium]|nr:transcription-repair coupling factor [Leptospiraceae bacterium]
MKNKEKKILLSLSSDSDIEKYLQSFRQHTELQNLFTKEWPNAVTGVPGGALSTLIYEYCRGLNTEKQRLMVILPRESMAEIVYEELRFLEHSAAPGATHSKTVFFPQFGGIPFTHAGANSEREGQRIRALAHLYHEGPVVFVTSIDAISWKLSDPQQTFEKSITVKTGDRIEREALLTQFVQAGYTREELVETPGQFAVKGSVIDIFSPGFVHPLRIDFFDDEIESLRLFDLLTQKSLTSIDSLQLFPAHEIIFENNELNLLLESALSQSKEIPPVLQDSLTDRRGIWDIYPMVRKTVFTGQEAPEFETFLYDVEASFARLEHLKNEREFLFQRHENRFFANVHDLFFSETELQNTLADVKKIYRLPHSLADFPLHLNDAPTFKGRISRLVEMLSGTEFKNKKIFLSSSISAQKERLEHILSAYEEIETPEFILAPFHSGFAWQNGMLLTEHELFGKSGRSQRIKKTSTEIIESFVDLNEGDYVVHVNYGIGRFVRLKRMTALGHERDFLEIEYNGADKLYVPLEKLQLVHRYIGATENPRLDFLGKKSSWEKTRARVEAAIESIADELLELYAERESARGFSYPVDSSFQEEFEAAFPYEETDHQIEAILDVKKDMESEKPMDRLVCGDVGFGKTEVAIRAAFKAVMAGKQVAVLCPTTVLAFQHFHTFTERFKEYPVSVDFISRFKTPLEIKKIKEKLKEGSLDIVIGTHALLSGIEYSHLGLLVIDEEQRFGVTHKEAIKQIKSNIDCLTMTATPIPRTLHMSLVGIRDLSLIETPPRNRMKIETYVLEEDEEILHLAIRNELERGGQVYILHNKVKTIQAQAGRIHSIYPKARVGILHGQMPDDEIENVMLDFYQRQYDILVTTTIIESGIDIPNVNTLIVLSAQALGLAQLYQIKGRVGRSDRQAYAYFFYPPNTSLNEVAQKRLNTLQEFDELGAGFKIAMKDLEIRGAGNILGKEQSGEILDVGFELYVSMLHEKIEEKRGNASPQVNECAVIIPQDFYFPDSYIVDTRQKMEFYKKIVSAGDVAALDLVASDLEDRFGPVPKAVESILLASKLRVMGTSIQLDKIEYLAAANSRSKDEFILVAGPGSKISGERLFSLISSDARFKPDAEDPRKLHFYPQVEDLNAQMNEILRILNYIQE